MAARSFSRLIHSQAAQAVGALSFFRYGTKVLSLIRLTWVARFLGPAALGAAGLSLLILSITEVFTETGVNIVLLKNPKKLETYIHTAFAVSIVRGILISLVIAILGPIVASTFGFPALIRLLPWIIAIPLVRGLINPASILYQQNLQFVRESSYRLTTQGIDLISGAFFVWWWQSEVGLLAGILTGAVVEMLLSHWLFPLKPKVLRARLSEVIGLYRESKFIIGHGIINYLTENADNLLVGKLLGPVGLGLYQTAYKLAAAVTIDFGSVVGQALYPVYAKRVHEKQSVVSIWKSSTLVLLSIFSLGAVVVVFGANPIIQKLLGDEWVSSVPALQLLYFAGVCKALITAWQPLAILAHTLRHSVVLSAIMLIGMAGLILIFAPLWGVMGAALAVLLVFVGLFPYGLWITRRSLRLL